MGEYRVIAQGYKVSYRVRKIIYNELQCWLHISMNIVKTAELYTLSR